MGPRGWQAKRPYLIFWTASQKNIDASTVNDVFRGDHPAEFFDPRVEPSPFATRLISKPLILLKPSVSDSRETIEAAYSHAVTFRASSLQRRTSEMAQFARWPQKLPLVHDPSPVELTPEQA
jgi:hypothetical protein